MSIAARLAAADWSDLQHFAAVARSGSIATAARSLGVNHSTVLRRIARLEAALGTRLFDRLTSGYAPTAAGNALAEQLGGVAERIERAQRRLLGLSEAIDGSVRLEVPDIAVDALLMPLLAAFRREHPGVTLQLAVAAGDAGDAGDTPARLPQRAADIALRRGERPPAPEARALAMLETTLCASQRYLASAGADRPLAQQRWVLADEFLADAPSRFGAFERWRRTHLADDRIALRIDSLRGAADAIAAGLGVGLLPRPLLHARAGLVELDAPFALPAERLWLVRHPDAHGTARVQRLADFLGERLRADAPAAAQARETTRTTTSR